MKDMIIGCFTNYDWSVVQFWANSIDLCGFRGDRVVVYYNTDRATLDRLTARGFYTCAFEPDRIAESFAYRFSFEVMLHRFAVYYEFLRDLASIGDYRYVVATDVRDVVFQRDPSPWLEAHLGEKNVCASAESLIYRDQPWNKTSMVESYPRLYEQMASRPVWNAGVQAGNIEVMRDLWLQLSMIGAAGFSAADQAAYNILLSLKPWSDMTLFTWGEDGWACQANTQARPNPLLLEPQPVWDGRYSNTSTGKRHVILHQYTSFDDWRDGAQRAYGDEQYLYGMKHAASVHPRDIDAADLELAITTSECPDLLTQLVDTSRRVFGFYTAHFPHTINYPWVAEKLNRLAPGSRVLDVGAGLSPLPLWLAERGFSVACVDNHPTVRTPPTQPDWNEWGFYDYGLLHPSLHAHHCSIEEFTPGYHFDAVYSVSVIAHLSRAVREEMLRRCRSLIRDGGLLLLAIDIIPSSDFLWNRSEGIEVEPPLRHGTINDVLEQLADLGFVVNESRVLRSVHKSRTDLLFVICCATGSPAMVSPGGA